MKYTAPAGWKNKLSTSEEKEQLLQREDKQHLLMPEDSAVKKHDQVSSAKEPVDIRQALLTHVEEIAVSGKAESIIAMESDLIENDLDRYAKADDKETTGSLKMPACMELRRLNSSLRLSMILKNTRPLTGHMICLKPQTGLAPG